MDRLLRRYLLRRCEDGRARLAHHGGNCHPGGHPLPFSPSAPAVSAGRGKLASSPWRAAKSCGAARPGLSEEASAGAGAVSGAPCRAGLKRTQHQQAEGAGRQTYPYLANERRGCTWADGIRSYVLLDGMRMGAVGAAERDHGLGEEDGRRRGRKGTSSVRASPSQDVTPCRRPSASWRA